jgi:ATP-dependent DNA helicase RecQ
MGAGFPIQAKALELLRRGYGSGARFRDGQWEAIESLVARRERVLVVQRTGWGKSLVYFLATRLFRDQGSGPTLIVSPLLSLMRNQLDAALRLDLRPASINSTNTDAWGIVAALRDDEIDLLLVSPEQLGSEHFANDVLPAVQAGIGLLVVDEAHCISDWGHDFRPDYKRIARVARQLPHNVPLLGTTATANQRVVEDVTAQFQRPERPGGIR